MAQRLGQGLTAKAVACGGVHLGEDRKLHGRRIKARQFQRKIFRVFVAGIKLGRLIVAALKIGPHLGAKAGRLHPQHPPGPRIADRRRAVHGGAQLLQQRLVHRIAAKVAHIAAPLQDRQQGFRFGGGKFHQEAKAWASRAHSATPAGRPRRSQRCE